MDYFQVGINVSVPSSDSLWKLAQETPGPTSILATLSGRDRVQSNSSHAFYSFIHSFKVYSFLPALTETVHKILTSMPGRARPDGASPDLDEGSYTLQNPGASLPQLCRHTETPGPV